MSETDRSAASTAGILLRRHAVPIALVWMLVFAGTVGAMLAFAGPGGSPTVPAAQQGDFERGLAPWQPDLDTRLERTTRGARSGTAAAAATAGSLRPFGLRWLEAVPSPRRGDRYTISAWFKGSGTSIGNDVVLQVHERGGSGGERVLAWRGRPLRASWMRTSVTGVVRNPDAESLDVYVWVQRPRRVGETFYVDDVEIMRARSGSAGASP